MNSSKPICITGEWSNVNDKSRRFEKLRTVPLFAALDHRLFLNKNGEDERLASLPRNQRRKIHADSKRIWQEYKNILDRINKSGVGYMVDHQLRRFLEEYNNRYSMSGIFTQPLSFNYFEAFCEIEIIEKSYAPYTRPAKEVNHLFSLHDYFDYITTPDASVFDIKSLFKLPEDFIFHFTPSGDIGEFTVMNDESREFVIAGFALIRRRNFLHWYLIGGDLHSEAEWSELSKLDDFIELDWLDPYKRPFLEPIIERDGSRRGK